MSAWRNEQLTALKQLVPSLWAGHPLLGSDVDTIYLDEIQVIESLMLVPALVGTCALVGTRL